LDVFAQIDKYDFKPKWLSNDFEGSWVKGVSAGGKLLLRLYGNKKKSLFLISVYQKIIIK